MTFLDIISLALRRRLLLANMQDGRKQTPFSLNALECAVTYFTKMTDGDISGGMQYIFNNSSHILQRSRNEQVSPPLILYLVQDTTEQRYTSSWKIPHIAIDNLHAFKR